MDRLAGKVVLVTGGSSGIGRAVAERVAAEGAAVVAGIRAGGGRALFVSADATVERDQGGLVAAAVGEYGRLDGAFNNAGGVGTPAPLAELAVDAWHAELALNLPSVFYGMRHQVPAMLATGGGAIVNNASLLGVVGVGGMAGYTAAKHGVVGLTRAAALEYATRGVRVNALITGNVDTPLYRRLVGAGPNEQDVEENDDQNVELPAPNPTGRVASAAEIAAFVAFLLSPEAAFVTGAALAVDGGFTAG